MILQNNKSGAKQMKELLLVLPVPFLIKNKQIFLESQACNGLKCWIDNFGTVIVAAPTIPTSLVQKYTSSFVWVDTASLSCLEQFEAAPLPWAYSLPKFLFYYFSVRSQLAHLIKRCRYLQFAIGGLWGDWAAIAAFEAHQQKRTFAIHTDRVEHKVMLETHQESSLPQQIKVQILSFLMAQYHQKIIQNCTLGLWHGHDCYTAYSPFCQNSYLIHNIHVKPSEQIEPEPLAQKIESILTEPKLKICYVGRMELMKAPLDWVRAIGKAKELGVNLQAVWLGDGSLLRQMQSLIEELNLSHCIEIPGFQSDRKKLLNMIKQSHLMLFTHITPESPRCLIESLICGTPIIGYSSHFSEDLIKLYGGGKFVPVKHWEELGTILLELFEDRQTLAKLIQEAAMSGRQFNDKDVFKERSELIKEFL